MSENNNKQMIVRVDPVLIRQLKVIAAHFDMSMAALVREVLDEEVDAQREHEAIDQALKAAGL